MNEEEELEERVEEKVEEEKTLKEKVKKIIPWAIGAVALAGLAALGYTAIHRDSDTIDVSDIDINLSVLKPRKVENISSSKVMNMSKIMDIPKVTEEISDVIDNSKREYSLPTDPFWVDAHVRSLPEGQHPSPEKVLELIQNGIDPADNVTWVDGYTKNVS
jgi:hypothetical protein